LLIHKGKRYEPHSAAVCADRICVNYEPGNVTLVLEEKTGYVKLTVAEVPEDTDIFMFGPYFVSKPQYGDILGSAFDDETAVCIQSLNPKTMGGTPEKYVEAHPFYGKDRIPPFPAVPFLTALRFRFPGASFCSATRRI